MTAGPDSFAQFLRAFHETIQNSASRLMDIPEEQSRRGEATFLATCASCHRPELTGSQIVPALVGDAFLQRWSRKTAGDLFEKVRNMPPVPIPIRPTPGEYADIVAFILSRNRIPAGQQELAGMKATDRVWVVHFPRPGFFQQVGQVTAGFFLSQVHLHKVQRQRSIRRVQVNTDDLEILQLRQQTQPKVTGYTGDHYCWMFIIHSVGWETAVVIADTPQCS